MDVNPSPSTSSTVFSEVEQAELQTSPLYNADLAPVPASRRLGHGQFLARKTTL